GEHLDNLTQRSLGYRLLHPLAHNSWTGEVEALARRLQTAPYPEQWPSSDLFCSVLLADGRRLVALARYGLVDHTPSQRRGGLELIGIVGPPSLSVSECFALYRGLKQRRQAHDSPLIVNDPLNMDDLAAKEGEASPPPDPMPVLPIRLWQEGALLFAATGPGDPDHSLRLLEQNAGGTWQWLPLVGGDFPLLTYAQRGSTVAWTPNLSGVAVKLDRKTADSAPQVVPADVPRFGWARTLAILAALFLLAANLGAGILLIQGLYPGGLAGVFDPAHASKSVGNPVETASGPKPEEVRVEFAEALFDVIAEQGQRRQWTEMEPRLVQRYERVARTHPTLRLKEGSSRGKAMVGAVSVLASRNPDRLEEVVRQALVNRGFSDKVIKAACDHVREQFAGEPLDYP
ncbi:MAG TPA: hypothetical protein VGZ25_01095, partial [Gemmataceae bacterium]|nr:hypothetical protein [Gemmataceae bacterium]